MNNFFEAPFPRRSPPLRFQAAKKPVEREMTKTVIFKRT